MIHKFQNSGYPWRRICDKVEEAATVLLIRVTQARWWNRSFLSSIPYRSINLTTTYKGKCIYGSPESNREVLAHSWNTRSRINALKRVRRGWVRAMTLITPSQGGTAQCLKRYPHPQFLSQWKVRVQWVSSWVPQLCRILSRKPTSFLPHPEYWSDWHNQVVEEVRRRKGREAMMLLTTPGLLQKACTQAMWDALPV